MCGQPRAVGFTVGLLNHLSSPGRVVFPGHVSILVDYRWMGKRVVSGGKLKVLISVRIVSFLLCSAFLSSDLR